MIFSNCTESSTTVIKSREGTMKLTTKVATRTSAIGTTSTTLATKTTKLLNSTIPNTVTQGTHYY